jgi:hypothetical protein
MKIASTTASPAHRSPRVLLRVEGDPERHRGERVSEVVDQVGEQRNAQRPRVDERLSERRQDQDAETPRDRASARPRTQDRAVDKAVRVPVLLLAMRMLMLADGLSLLVGNSVPIQRLAPSCHEARSTRSR